MSQGQTTRRQQRIDLARVQRSGARTRAPCANHAVGTRQRSEQAEDLVDGVPALLAEQEAESPQHGSGDRPHHDVRQRASRHVRQQKEQRIAAVDLVWPVGCRTQRAPIPRPCLGVVDDGVGRAHDAVSSEMSTPAEIDVVAEQREPGIEPAQLMPDVTPHQHAGRADCERVAEAVALTLVLLLLVEAGLTPARPGDRDANLEQCAPVVPAADLGSDNTDGRILTSRLQQVPEGAGGWCRIIVEQPEPLVGAGRGVVRIELIDTELQGCAVTDVAGSLDVLLVEVLVEDPRGGIVAARVHDNEPIDRPPLRVDGGESPREPAGPIVTDEDGADPGMPGA